MKSLLMGWAFVVSLTVPAFAGETAWIGCKQLTVALAPTLNAEIVEKEWASGNTHDEQPAVLELRDCAGGLLDSAPLAAPLAQIDPKPIRGVPEPTFLVSVDLTQSSGSYNGPLTIPFEVIQDRLHPVSAKDADGTTSPIRLALTGKAAWERISISNKEEILAVNCERSGKGFTINYLRYRPDRAGWTVRQRSTPGFWETESAFPALQLFP